MGIGTGECVATFSFFSTARGDSDVLRNTYSWNDWQAKRSVLHESRLAHRYFSQGGASTDVNQRAIVSFFMGQI